MDIVRRFIIEIRLIFYTPTASNQGAVTFFMCNLYFKINKKLYDNY